MCIRDRSTAALLEHVKANGGRFCTVPVGQTPGVKPRSSKPPAPKDEVLASWEDDPATHDGIKAIMDADGVASAEAQRRYFAKYNHQ